MRDDNIIDYSKIGKFKDELTAILREGARRLLQVAVEAELGEFLKQYEDRRTEQNLRLVVRSGHHPERSIQTGIGSVPVRIPKVRSNDGKPVTFRSSVVPPYVRKSRTLEAWVPWLYLKGVSTGEMAGVLSGLLGKQAKGFSPSVVKRLKRVWLDERKEWTQRDLSQDRWVYVWADGVYSGLRNEETKLCCLVVIGVDDQGRKSILAIEDGVRESTLSWQDVLLDLKSRGMNAPKLAIGDGAMGFWSALDRVYPEARHQRCRVHKTANVLAAMPKAIHPKVKSALQQIWMAETRDHANQAFDRFLARYQEKYPKAAVKLIQDRKELMNFFDFPAEHWQSIRTTNPIESTFATIRHRTRTTRGCLSRDTMLDMMFKLGQCAESRWRRLRGFRRLGQVIEGVQFKDGIEVQSDQKTVAAG